MGFETFIRFQKSPNDPRPYAPDVFLRGLATPSLACSSDAVPRVFEYRVPGTLDRWPAVVITIEADGFLVCEYDRAIGTQLFGPLVKYALDHATDERVLIESA